MEVEWKPVKLESDSKDIIPVHAYVENVLYFPTAQFNQIYTTT